MAFDAEIMTLIWRGPLSQRAVGLLLRQGAEVNARDKYWQTALHVAAANRATRCAEALLPQLSSLNVADRMGRTALHHAAHSGYLEVSRCPACWLETVIVARRSAASAKRCCSLDCFSVLTFALCVLCPDGEVAAEQRGQSECQR